MRLERVTVQNHKSIIYSGMVEINPEITALIGKTGSGKTSFLETLTLLAPDEMFTEAELPKGSEIKQKFLNREIQAADIILLTADFLVDESDRELLPNEFKEESKIKVDRYFDGHFVITTSKNIFIQGSVDLRSNIDNVTGILESLKENFTVAQGRLGPLAQQHGAFSEAVENFTHTNFSNLKELSLSLQSLTNTLNGLPKDDLFQNELNQRILELSQTRNNIEQALQNDAVAKLIELLPRPLYKNDVDDLVDKVSVDEFIANPEVSDTFRRLAIVSGLKPSGVQSVRNTPAAEQASYFGVVSRNLSKQLNDFWKQEEYDFKISISGSELTFTVTDRTTRKETSVLERSDGFRWWTSFFLEMSTHLTKSSRPSIILLDNPATNLHDDGKADVLRFLTKITESGKLQIIYSTHERALIDPWRIEQIRMVEKGSEGTKIKIVRSNSRSDLLGEIRRSIGSPARYSLFGAPKTVAFEGISDINIFSALNEFLEQKGLNHLNKDSYSINAFNGMGNASEFCFYLKNLGVNFVLIVDSSTAISNVKKVGEDSDYQKYFVEISEVINKAGDIEDLIHPKLYHLSFGMAYKPILKDIPSLEEIEQTRENKKLIHKYEGWFNSQR